MFIARIYAGRVVKTFKGKTFGSVAQQANRESAKLGSPQFGLIGQLDGKAFTPLSTWTHFNPSGKKRVKRKT